MNQYTILIFGIVALWLSVLTFYLLKTVSHYKKLIDGTNKRNLLDILENVLSNLTVNKKNIQEIKRELTILTEKSITHIQKVGVLRFNPFSDTGGDQSFVLTVLDGKDTGIVLTSLHSRGLTRWYAKNVKNGKGVDHELSKEETEAIKKAVPIIKKKGKNK